MCRQPILVISFIKEIKGNNNYIKICDEKAADLRGHNAA